MLNTPAEHNNILLFPQSGLEWNYTVPEACNEMWSPPDSNASCRPENVLMLLSNILLIDAGFRNNNNNHKKNHCNLKRLWLDVWGNSVTT